MVIIANAVHCSPKLNLLKQMMKTVTTETLIGLNKLLELNFEGHEQDWSIEFADARRLQDFIDVAKNVQLSADERYAVLSLVLASYDDHLNSDRNADMQCWDEIITLLEGNRQLYNDLLNYWALWEEDKKGDWFAITPLIRTYLNDYADNQ